jgi:hypothetical protein
LDSRLKIVRDRLGILTGKKLTLEVFGDKDWQPLGPVVKGQHLYMTAAGSWMGDVNDEATRCGPSGRLGDGKWNVVAHIDDDWFNIGSGLELIVPRSGTLEFSMNDSPGHKKGSGKLTVTVVLVN